MVYLRYHVMRTCLTLASLILVVLVSTAGLAQTQEPITIDFWHGWGGTRIPLMDEVIARFEARYPWITVNQRIIATGSLDEQLTVSILGNVPPDLTMISFADSMRFGLQGGLMPLQPLVNVDGMQLDDYFYPPVVEQLQNHPIMGPGQYYYLPQLIDANWYLYYNKQHFEQAGLDVHNPPTTWNELEVAGRVLNRRNGDGDYIQIGMDVAEGRRITEPYYEWLKSAGGRQYSDDLQKVIIGEPESLGMLTLEWIIRYTNEVNGGLTAQNALHANAGTGFNRGLYSMVLRGPWSYFTIQQGAPDIDFAMAEMPHRDDYDFRTSMSLGWGYAIPANASHPEAAWLLMKFLTTDVEGGGWFMLQQGRPGAAIQGNLQPEYYDVNPYWGVIQDSYNNSVPAEFLAPVGNVLSMHRTMVAEAVAGEYSPQAAMERMITQWQGELDAFWTEVRK